MTEEFVLPTEESINSNRALGEKQLEVLTVEQIKLLRRRAKTDLFFLSYGILGYNKLSVNLHGSLCTWMEANKNERFRLILLPRGHYKSTIATISDSIRIALPDDEGDRPWPESLGTNVRLCIGHETADMASHFLGSIIGHFTSNPMLMALFPECIPSLRKHRINKSELELPRSEIWNEATFETIGVGGRSQGRHYNKLKLDDLIGDKARDSKTEMATAIQWINNIQAFFSTFTMDKLDFIGTRYAFGDIYEHIMKTYGHALARYIRSAEEPDEQNILRPIFPESFTTESFEIIKKDPKIWSSQYANNPQHISTEFDKSWKKYYTWINKFRLVYHDGKTRDVLDIDEMDRVIFIDPAVSGLTGIVVTGTDTKERNFVLETKKEAISPPQLVSLLFQMVSRWAPRTVVIEEVLFSEVYRHWLQREMKFRGVLFHITPAKVKGQAKDIRIKGLANYFSGGQIIFHPSQLDIIEEYDRFGASTENMHLLDALAYGPSNWFVPIAKKKQEEYREAENKMLAARNPLTGY
jgi:hypothetical protein